jgi:transcriptional regulator, araC family
MSKIYIKNMVCDRCKMAVEQTLQRQNLHPIKVDLGEAIVEEELTETQLLTLRTALKELGFELLGDRRQQTIDLIKSSLIKLVHYQDNQSATTLSDYLISQLHQDYSSLSKLFSEVEGKTIERYYIELRIERVKELIRYDELTLTQIAQRMNYSSVAYLSSQFKAVTGMTPSQFRGMKTNTRMPLDQL